MPFVKSSSHGYREDEAAKLLVDAVRSELHNYFDNQGVTWKPQLNTKSRLILCPKLSTWMSPKISYICTEDGFVGALCVVALAAVPLVLSKTFPWKMLVDVVVVLPCLAINTWLNYETSKVEVRNSETDSRSAESPPSFASRGSLENVSEMHQTSHK